MDEAVGLLKEILSELKTLNQSIKSQIDTQEKMYLENKGQSERAMQNMMSSLSPGMRSIMQNLIKGKSG